MAHINPTLPADGQQNWAGTADAYLVALTNKINSLDDQVTNLIANGGSGSGLLVDNGDGTVTFLPAGATSTGTPGSVGLAFDTDGTPFLAI